jgi:hypothetical protein
MRYLPAVARRLSHSRELGEPFDFLTWFEYAPEHAAHFEELLKHCARPKSGVTWSVRWTFAFVGSSSQARASSCTFLHERGEETWVALLGRTTLRSPRAKSVTDPRDRLYT